MRLSLGSAQRPAARHRLAGAAAVCLCATVAAAAPLTGAAPASAAPAGTARTAALARTGTHAGPATHAVPRPAHSAAPGQGGTGSAGPAEPALAVQGRAVPSRAVPGRAAPGPAAPASSSAVRRVRQRAGGGDRRRAAGRARGDRPLSRPRRAGAAQGEGLRLRRRRRGHRPGAGRQGPARPVPARQHAEGPDRHRLDAGAQPGRDRGRLAPGREPDTEQGRADPGRQLHGLRPVQGAADDLRQRRGGRAGPGDRVLRQGHGADQRRSAPSAGLRHGRREAERPGRAGPARVRLRRGAVRPAGAGRARVHARRDAADRSVSSSGSTGGATTPGGRPCGPRTPCCTRSGAISAARSAGPPRPGLRSSAGPAAATPRWW